MRHFISMGIFFLGPFAGLAIGAWLFVCPPGLDADTAGPREVKIRVKETSLVQGPQILLGEVAQIQAGSFLKEILQTMELGNAPKPGKIKQLNKNQVVSLIQSQPGMPEAVSIEIPENIYVKRDSQQIEQQKVREQVELFLSDSFRDKEYELEQLSIKDLDLYPQGNVDLSGISNSRIDKNGNFTLFMDILIDGNREDRIRISGKVAVYENILCAKRNLAKGEQLLGTDVYWVRKNILSLRGDGIRTSREIENKLLKTGIKKDDPISASDLQEIPLIRKGDVITLVARSNRLLIATSGISQEDGYADQLIRVENIRSGKIVRGLVKEKFTVEVIH
ncbi:MAG: flagellar basal body P-ring formation chaperone FlgA [Proteobacteria bacterium]|nr:flagellar basal body P-ring formation protein FlgA [Desulfobacula sp.]MBU3953933.1 flagellar basal body P-ring formation chaperone FlgA [Pseudomonadota bacterium]MBU4130896.1 flagellar basal body P-ring formation chaperone FlgA [Pseudomonadota bacterium]